MAYSSEWVERVFNLLKYPAEVGDLCKVVGIYTIECMMKNARLLIVDDHEIFRRGLRALLEPHAEWQICGEAIDGVDAVEQTRTLHPDIIVMDVTMPRLNGLEATRSIKRDCPETQVVIITQHDSPQIRSAAMDAGAGAFVTKSAVGSELVTAIRSIAKNSTK